MISPDAIFVPAVQCGAWDHLKAPIKYRNVTLLAFPDPANGTVILCSMDPSACGCLFRTTLSFLTPSVVVQKYRNEPSFQACFETGRKNSMDAAARSFCPESVQRNQGALVKVGVMATILNDREFEEVCGSKPLQQIMRYHPQLEISVRSLEKLCDAASRTERVWLFKYDSNLPYRYMSVEDFHQVLKVGVKLSDDNHLFKEQSGMLYDWAAQEMNDNLNLGDYYERRLKRLSDFKSKNNLYTAEELATAATPTGTTQPPKKDQPDMPLPVPGQLALPPIPVSDTGSTGSADAASSHQGPMVPPSDAVIGLFQGHLLTSPPTEQEIETPTQTPRKRMRGKSQSELSGRSPLPSPGRDGPIVMTDPLPGVPLKDTQWIANLDGERQMVDQNCGVARLSADKYLRKVGPESEIGKHLVKRLAVLRRVRHALGEEGLEDLPE